MSAQQRIIFAALLQATPKAIEAMTFRLWAKEDRRWAPLYEKLVGPSGRLRAEDDARRHDAMADAAEEEMKQEAERAARIAAIVETWLP